MPAVLGQLLKECHRVMVLRGEVSLAGQPLVLVPTPKLDPRVEVTFGNWTSEAETRNAGMELLSDCDYVFTVDSDEIFSDAALTLLGSTCRTEKPRALLGGCHTYWKTTEWRIDPPEQIVAPVVVHKDVRFERLRMFPGRHLVLPSYLFHHLSYVRTDEEMQAKLRNFGHASEVVPGWYERVWKGWDKNPKLEDLHPTHPTVYKRAVKADGALRTILDAYGVS
jgi:hypothetical protein